MRNAAPLPLYRHLRILALAVGAVWCWAANAQGVVRLTLLDGEARVLQGAQHSQATVGQKLNAGTVIDTTGRTSLLRLEWPDKTAVDLGPSTRALLMPGSFRARSGKPPVLYLLRGWAKVSGGGQTPAGGVLTPQIEVLPQGMANGALVLHVQASGVQVFAESGAAEVLQRPAGHALGVAAGAFYNLESPVMARPPTAWLALVPRAFRDNIPRRAAALSGPPAEGQALPAPAYADLSDWLTAEPDVRKAWPALWAPLLHDAAFRRAVQAALPRHPEWAAALAAAPR